MNKTEKIICIILGAVLAWYLFSENAKSKERAKAAAEQAAIAATNETAVAATTQATSVEEAKPFETIDATVSKPVMPSDPERIVALESDEVKLELTTWGAAVKSATLKKYAKDRGEVSESNPAVSLDFSGDPLGASYRAGAVVPAFSVAETSSNSVTFASGDRRRTIRLEDGYRIVLEDEGEYTYDDLRLSAMAGANYDKYAQQCEDEKYVISSYREETVEGTVDVDEEIMRTIYAGAYDNYR